jgi:hypothetical protein
VRGVPAEVIGAAVQIPSDFGPPTEAATLGHDVWDQY